MQPNNIQPISDPIPYIHFFSQDNLGTLWQYISAVALLAVPLLLIVLATEYGGYLIEVIRASFSRRRTDEEYDGAEYDRD